MIVPSSAAAAAHVHAFEELSRTDGTMSTGPAIVLFLHSSGLRCRQSKHKWQLFFRICKSPTTPTTVNWRHSLEPFTVLHQRSRCDDDDHGANRRVRVAHQLSDLRTRHVERLTAFSESIPASCSSTLLSLTRILRVFSRYRNEQKHPRPAP